MVKQKTKLATFVDNSLCECECGEPIHWTGDWQLPCGIQNNKNIDTKNVDMKMKNSSGIDKGYVGAVCPPVGDWHVGGFKTLAEIPRRVTVQSQYQHSNSSNSSKNSANSKSNEPLILATDGFGCFRVWAAVMRNFTAENSSSTYKFPGLKVE